jgi:hypothetical protein
VQVSLSKNGDPISRITRAKRTGGMIQVVEPSKCEALSANHNTDKIDITSIEK